MPSKKKETTPAADDDVAMEEVPNPDVEVAPSVDVDYNNPATIQSGEQRIRIVSPQ